MTSRNVRHIIYKKDKVRLGVGALALVVKLFSKHFIVSPTFLMKVLPLLKILIPKFPPFMIGIHKHGVSHSDAEYLLRRAEEEGKIIRREFKKEIYFFKPKIKYQLKSTLSYTEIDQIVREIGIPLEVIDEKVATIARRYGGNPENIEKASLKWILNRFREPTAWLYYSPRWEMREYEMKYRGLKQLIIGPLSIPLPDFVKELIPVQKMIFKIYASVVGKKKEPNSEYHFKINALKKRKGAYSLQGEKVVLFGYLYTPPVKLMDETECLVCTFCDSAFFPNENHKIKLLIDSSDQAIFEDNPINFLKYQLMILGKVSDGHIRVSAILKITELTENKHKQIHINSFLDHL